jgi:hypothetical protein
MPIMMLVAVTVPSLAVVPMTAMDSPTFSAADVTVPDLSTNVVVLE